MDPTLTQLLKGMFLLSQDNDALRARVAELATEGLRQVEELRARIAELETLEREGH